MKLGVEVNDACDLMPKDGQVPVSPYVEIDFDAQRRRTHTKPRDLNPTWHETILFDLSVPSLLPNQTITISVYHDRTTNPVSAAATSRNFLGRVRISGAFVAPDLSSASVQRFPLDKRGIFSHIRVEIALRLYAVPDNSAAADDRCSDHRPTGTVVIIVSKARCAEERSSPTSYRRRGLGG